MTIKMANNLIALRKAARLSQEEVADKLGVSRQAVSKWERAEAAPDTDNLIALSKLYGVSVDSLLGLDEKKSDPNIEVDLPFVKVNVHGNKKSAEDKVNVSINEDWFNDGADSFYDEDEKNEYEPKYTVDVSGTTVKSKSLWFDFPYPILATVAFLVMGFFFNLWHPGWIVFFTIPIYYWFAKIITRRRLPTISAALVITIIYLVLGFGWQLWHPWWIIFITIPIFDFIFKAIRGLRKKNN